jgi:hypothetical protein
MLTERLYQEEEQEEGYEFEEYDESGLEEDSLQQEIAAKRMADLEESVGNAPKKARVEQGRAFDLLETLVGGQRSNPAEENATVQASISKQKLLEEIEQELEAENAGQEIPQDMATVLNKLMEAGLPEEKLNIRLNKYKRPSNCPKMVKVKVNTLIWEQLTPNTRSQDVKLQKVSNLLVKAVCAMTGALTDLKAKAEADESLGKTFRTLLDSFTFLAAGSRELNVKRRELLKPDLNASYKLLCAPSVPMTEELFGDDLSTQVKDITEANKTAKSISRGFRGFRGRGGTRSRYPRRPFLGRGGRGGRSTYYRGQGGYAGSYGQGQQRRGRGRGTSTQGQSQTPGSSS